MAGSTGGSGPTGLSALAEISRARYFGAAALRAGNFRQAQLELRNMGLYNGSGLELGIGREIWMRIAGRLRPLGVEQEISGMRMQQCHAAIMQRHVAKLSFA